MLPARTSRYFPDDLTHWQAYLKTGGVRASTDIHLLGGRPDWAGTTSKKKSVKQSWGGLLDGSREIRPMNPSRTSLPMGARLLFVRSVKVEAFLLSQPENGADGESRHAAMLQIDKLAHAKLLCRTYNIRMVRTEAAARPRKARCARQALT